MPSINRRYLIWTLLFLGAASYAAATASFEMQPDGSVSASNSFFSIRAGPTYFRAYVKLPWLNGRPDTSGFGLEFNHWREKLQYRRSNETARCSKLDSEFALNNWNLAVSQRPELGGAVLLNHSATFGYDDFCRLSVLVYIPGSSSQISVGRHTIKINPRSLKISVLANCPWERQIARSLNEPLVSGSYRFLSRRSGINFNLTVDMPSGNLALLSQLQLSSIPQPSFFDEGNVFERRACDFTNAQSGVLRSLWPTFNFENDTAGLSIPFGFGRESYNVSNNYNGWALADAASDSRADLLDTLIFQVIKSQPLSDELFRFKIPLTLAVEFFNRFLYDPTFDLLFNDPTYVSPDASPQTIQENAQQEQAVAIGAIVGGVIAAVAVVALAAAVLAVPKLRRAILPFSSRESVARQNFDAEEEPVVVDSNSPNGDSVRPTTGSWTPARASK